MIVPNETLFLLSANDPGPKYSLLEHYIRYMLSPANIVDLATFLPYWIAIIVGQSKKGAAFLRVLRLLRVVRILRLFKVMRRFKVVLVMFDLIIATLVKSSVALGVVTMLLLLLMIFFGCIIYACEAGTFRVTEAYPLG